MSIPKHILKVLKLLVRSWAHWLHLVYAALLIVGYAISDAVVAQDVKITIAYIALFVYVLVLVGLLTYSLFKHISLSRQARYAEAIECIQSAVHQLNDAHLYIDSCYESSSSVSSQALRSHLQPALDWIAKAFSISTGVSHRACIKLLNATPDGTLFVRTFCRDHDSDAANRAKDLTEGDRHTVDRNTAFQLILCAGRPYFLCQSISGYTDYQNTSKEQLAGPRFPYEGTIVVPIDHVAAQEESADPAKIPQSIALGFLAIDCTAPNVYLERYDVSLASIAADALFPVLRRWHAPERVMAIQCRDTGRHRTQSWRGNSAG